jgi:hypothetical protein
VAASLRFPHHGKGGVLVNLERLERISDEKDVHKRVQSNGWCGMELFLLPSEGGIVLQIALQRGSHPATAVAIG